MITGKGCTRIKPSQMKNKIIKQNLSQYETQHTKTIHPHENLGCIKIDHHSTPIQQHTNKIQKQHNKRSLSKRLSARKVKKQKQQGDKSYRKGNQHVRRSKKAHFFFLKLHTIFFYPMRPKGKHKKNCRHRIVPAANRLFKRLLLYKFKQFFCDNRGVQLSTRKRCMRMVTVIQIIDKRLAQHIVFIGDQCVQINK